MNELSTRTSWLAHLGLNEAPDLPVILSPDGVVTRSQLREMVLESASHLGTLHPDDVVQLRFERSDPRAIVAALAVWERGAVPLFSDAATSPEQAAAAAEIAGATLWLAGSQTTTSLARSSSFGFEARELRPTEQRLPINPDIGYLIQTSGTSGTPRVVGNRSSSLRNTTDALVERYALVEGCRSLQFAPLGYDAWLADVLPTIQAGAVVTFGPRGPWQGLRAIEETLWNLDVTHAVLPPSVWRRLRRLPPLVMAVSAGEALDARTSGLLQTASKQVVNAYGPSEAAVCAMTYEVVGGEERIPLGSPLPGVEITAPEDRDGLRRLRIGGVGVGTGYIGVSDDGAAAELGTGWFGTSERGPFFQTADLVECQGDDFYFVGRADRCVKRSGRLVNLDRVQAVVRTLEGVTDCVVWNDGPRLLCEVVTEEALPHDLWQRMQEVLDPWERPALARADEDLLRNASDKLDFNPASHARARPARLAAIWADVLQAPPIDGTHFFAAGGDSLGAMALLDRIAAELGVEVDIADFLEDPTLAGLCSLVGTDPGEAG